MNQTEFTKHMKNARQIETREQVKKTEPDEKMQITGATKEEVPTAFLDVKDVLPSSITSSTWGSAQGHTPITLTTKEPAPKSSTLPAPSAPLTKRSPITTFRALEGSPSEPLLAVEGVSQVESFLKLQLKATCDMRDVRQEFIEKEGIDSVRPPQGHKSLHQAYGTLASAAVAGLQGLENLEGISIPFPIAPATALPGTKQIAVSLAALSARQQGAIRDAILQHNHNYLAPFLLTFPSNPNKESFVLLKSLFRTINLLTQILIAKEQTDQTSHNLILSARSRVAKVVHIQQTKVNMEKTNTKDLNEQMADMKKAHELKIREMMTKVEIAEQLKMGMAIKVHDLEVETTGLKGQIKQMTAKGFELSGKLDKRDNDIREMRKSLQDEKVKSKELTVASTGLEKRIKGLEKHEIEAKETKKAYNSDKAKLKELNVFAADMEKQFKALEGRFVAMEAENNE
jgi:hypothetical protein